VHKNTKKLTVFEKGHKPKAKPTGSKCAYDCAQLGKCLWIWNNSDQAQNLRRLPAGHHIVKFTFKYALEI